MKIEIDTNNDPYETWKKVQEVIEHAYQITPIRILEVKGDFLYLRKGTTSE